MIVDCKSGLNFWAMTAVFQRSKYCWMNIWYFWRSGGMEGQTWHKHAVLSGQSGCRFGFRDKTSWYKATSELILIHSHRWWIGSSLWRPWLNPSRRWAKNRIEPPSHRQESIQTLNSAFWRVPWLRGDNSKCQITENDVYRRDERFPQWTDEKSMRPGFKTIKPRDYNMWLLLIKTRKKWSDEIIRVI